MKKCDRAIRRHAADTEQFETFDKMVAESLGSLGNPSVTIRNILQKWSLGRSVARSPIGPNVLLPDGRLSDRAIERPFLTNVSHFCAINPQATL